MSPSQPAAPARVHCDRTFKARLETRLQVSPPPAPRPPGLSACPQGRARTLPHPNRAAGRPPAGAAPPSCPEGSGGARRRRRLWNGLRRLQGRLAGGRRLGGCDAGAAWCARLHSVHPVQGGDGQGCGGGGGPAPGRLRRQPAAGAGGGGLAPALRLPLPARLLPRLPRQDQPGRSAHGGEPERQRRCGRARRGRGPVAFSTPRGTSPQWRLLPGCCSLLQGHRSHSHDACRAAGTSHSRGC